MNISKLLSGLFFISCFFLAPVAGFTQISSNAAAVLPTEYSSGNQDSIHIFCGKKGDTNASLTASSPNTEPASFEWLKYNELSRNFDLYPFGQSGSTSSEISNLGDGCYRVNITFTSGVKTYTAWVFNNFIEAKAEISESDCNSFTLKGTIDPLPTLTYVDLPTGQSKVLGKDIQVKWLEGETVVNRVITSKVFDPPTKDTDFTLEVTDKFGCTAKAEVRYLSIVTKASFEYKKEDQGKYNDPEKPEAPLTVTFTNTSENGDAGKYEWYFFKDLQKIKDEEKAGTFKESIQDIIYSDNPVYTYEETGQYKVKLVSKKVTEFTTCTDTFYMSGYIVLEKSFIEAPNVFTPDGNEVNDNFAVKFFSMKSLKISIFNRWGKILHTWENNNIAGFSKTITESVWDGKVGGRLANPGVYYYVAEGIGRDGKRRTANGFFHLFRGK